MNYLELVQESIRQSGAHLNPPDSLSNIDGLSFLFKEWVSQAWKEIQLERRDWQFGIEESNYFVQPISGNINTVALPENLSNDVQKNWRLIALREVYISDPSDTSKYPQKVTYVPWSSWPRVYGKTYSGDLTVSQSGNTNTPRYYTVSPDGSMKMFPAPDKNYTMEFYAPKTIQTLSAEEDVPFIPEEYHHIIVWKCLMDYAMYHDDRGIFEKARNKYGVYKKRLESAEMPSVTLRTDSLYRN